MATHALFTLRASNFIPSFNITYIGISKLYCTNNLKTVKELRNSDSSFKLYPMYEDVTGPLTIYRNSGWFLLSTGNPVAQLFVVQNKPIVVIQDPEYRDHIIRVMEYCQKSVPVFSFREHL